MLVDVRHEASHNELPSLALLRLAAEEALQWLQASYWQRQADHLAACRAHVSALLRVRGGSEVLLHHRYSAECRTPMHLAEKHVPCERWSPT